MALWVRSYAWLDQIIVPVSEFDSFAVTSIQGQFVFGRTNDPRLQTASGTRSQWRGFPLQEWNETVDGPNACFPDSVTPHELTALPMPQLTRNAIVTTSPGTTYYYELLVPIWLTLSVTVAIGASLWVKWR
jgi:hypothetical protein